MGKYVDTNVGFYVAGLIASFLMIIFVPVLAVAARVGAEVAIIGVIGGLIFLIVCSCGISERTINKDIEKILTGKEKNLFKIHKVLAKLRGYAMERGMCEDLIELIRKLEKIEEKYKKMLPQKE